MPKLHLECHPPQEQGPQKLFVRTLIDPTLADQAGVVVTHLVVRKMESGRALPQLKGGTPEPPQGATDQRLPDPEVTSQAVRKLHLSRSKIELLGVKKLHTSKIGKVVMKLIAITLISRRRRMTTTIEEEKTAQRRQEGHHCIPTSSAVARSMSCTAGLPKKLGV